MKKQSKPRAKINMGRLIKIVFVSGVVLLFLWLFGRAFIADYFSINSSSMYPTIKPGNTIVVNKLIFGARIYKRFNFESEELKSFRVKGVRKVKVNDIIVFNYPFDYELTRIRFEINYVYVKRVAGLPGDTLSIESGFYKNNNYPETIGDYDTQSLLSEIYRDSLMRWRNGHTFPYNEEIYNWNDLNFGPLYVPKRGAKVALNQNSYILYKLIIEYETGEKFNIDNGRLYLGQNIISEYTFKNNYYFVAGDNVLNSFDSRRFGLIPEEYIVGVVGWIL